MEKCNNHEIILENGNIAIVGDSFYEALKKESYKPPICKSTKYKETNIHLDKFECNNGHTFDKEKGGKQMRTSHRFEKIYCCVCGSRSDNFYLRQEPYTQLKIYCQECQEFNPNGDTKGYLKSEKS